MSILMFLEQDILSVSNGAVCRIAPPSGVFPARFLDVENHRFLHLTDKQITERNNVVFLFGLEKKCDKYINLIDI